MKYAEAGHKKACLLLFFFPPTNTLKPFCTSLYFYAKRIACMRGTYTPPGFFFCDHKSHFTSLCQVVHDWKGAVAW